MPLTTAAILSALTGAYRLARFDRTGMEYFDRTPDGALNSFYAALVVLPAYALLLVIRLWDQVDDTPLLQLLTVESIAYVVSWTAFPLALFRISTLMGREALYPGALAAYNWSAVLQMAIYLPTIVLSATGLLPPMLSEGLAFGVMMAMLTYQWFVLRTALSVSSLAAAALVLLDLFLSATISDLADGML
ncbi:hypothetical protein [Azospirillum picis]|uniref:Yip1 domain-containing protein n=1 Tax=Azospirillum picis TaxID=488438 RepID=A0ABU0MRW5_9PROT|nr:hypothetical protein [Azospirillum picis]MBP2302359.1 hypothetical protein [Azospirillum picis]MDQ0535938.1 hypothetical protein [Azospirillum picis]